MHTLSLNDQEDVLRYETVPSILTRYIPFGFTPSNTSPFSPYSEKRNFVGIIKVLFFSS